MSPSSEQQQLIELRLQLDNMRKAADVLRYSYEKVSALFDGLHEQTRAEDVSYDALEALEALCSRFARASDILIQKLLRLIDMLDLETPGTLRDRINRAEKKSLIKGDDAISIRDLRNEIAHDYIAEAVYELSQNVLEYTPALLEAYQNVCKYAKQKYGIENSSRA